MDQDTLMEYSVAVQSSDGQSDAVMDMQQVFSDSNARSEVSETSDGGTSAVLDPNGRAHNVQRLINPGSPRQSNNQTTYNQPDPSSQNNLTQYPSRTSQNDTLVLSDAMINSHFYEALQSSTQALSFALSDDPQNNQSGSTILPYTPTASGDFLSEELFQELAGIDQIEPMITDFLNNEYNEYSYDNSSAHSGYTPLSNAGAPDSSMVIGLGNDFDKTRPCSLSLPGGMVFNEQHAVAVRKTDFVPQTPDSVPMEYPQFSGLGDLVQSPLVTPEAAFPNQVNVQPTEESKQKPGSIDENLSLIKMMNQKVKPRRVHGLVAPNYSVPTSQLSPIPITASPKTPYPVQVSSPAASDHTPSPKATDTPITPSNSTKGPFSIRSFGDNGMRCFELGIREDLSASDQMMGLKALFYCCEMTKKFKENMDNPCDLKVANNVTANLCEFVLDSEGHKLISKVPRDCVPLEKFLSDNSEKIDLRGRQLIVQQVLNALANIHTGGSEDRMSFWGSFLVWVDRKMRVYLLLDFPVMLAKMEQSQLMAGFDPRIEDMKAVKQMYNDVFKPYISSASSWPSPGLVKLLGKRFEDILSRPSSGSRMAEIARNFGERRMCKIEVDVLSLDTVIYCLEHETLQRALSPLENVIPPHISTAWEIANLHTRRTVGKEDIAIAGGAMKLQLCPCFDVPSPYKDGLLIFSKF